MKNYMCVMLLAVACQQTVVARALDAQQCAGDVTCQGVMVKTGTGFFTALPNTWRPLIRRPQTTPPAPPPAQPLPSPRPPAPNSSTGRPSYPSYLPGSDYARRS